LKADGYSPTTKDLYSIMLNILKDFLSNPDVSEITSKDLIGYFAYLRLDYKPQRMNGSQKALSGCTLQNQWKAIVVLLTGLPVHTLTFDNGKEFAGYEDISQALNTAVYFAHPYASWERGTNENTNGLIRQYILKDKNFRNLSVEEILFAEYRLNTRPRKCLNFDQPMVFLKNLCCT